MRISSTDSPRAMATWRTRWSAVLRLWVMLALPLAGVAPAWADDCGMENIRPCVITERKPSCDINLAESQGMCVRPACGKENARPCSAFERTAMDLVLKAPMPQPCDANLKLDGGVCVHPPCGREGAAPCNVLQRLPSCNLNLAETPAGCVHPNCGRLGEAPCGLAVKRATFGPCDVNLIPRNGECVRPGVPGSSAGATSGGVNAAVPAQPAPPKTAGGIEPDTDRPGNDLHGFNVAQANPAMCQASCSNDAQCVAWTYVKPGIQGPAPRCYLKNAAPAPTRNTCCVSGAKGGTKLLQPLR